jgi:hypothetical protein
MRKSARHVAKWIAAGVAIGVITISTVYLFWRTSTVLVENQTGVRLSDVHIELGGDAFWTGTLAPGESHREFGFVKPNDIGGLVISFSSNGTTVQREFSSGFLLSGEHHELRILPSFEVECEWTNSGPEASCGDQSKLRKSLGIE